MLPTVIIFLLFQAICATSEFPNLMRDIKLIWDEVDLTDKIDSSLTASIDGQVPVLIFCGPFPSSAKGGECNLSARYPIPDGAQGCNNIIFPLIYNSLDLSSDEMTLFYTLNETHSCMSTKNYVPNLPSVYKRFEGNRKDWNSYHIDYTCKTSSSMMKTMTILVTGIVFVVLLAIAFKVGQRKGLASNCSEAYGPLGGSNIAMAYTGNSAYGAHLNGNA